MNAFHNHPPMNIVLSNLVPRLPLSFFDLLRRELEPLAAARQIDEARVRIERPERASPPWHVNIQLVTPGPDFTASAAAHTVREAVTRVIGDLAGKIGRRREALRQRLRKNGATRGAVARG